MFATGEIEKMLGRFERVPPGSAASVGYDLRQWASLVRGNDPA